MRHTIIAERNRRATAVLLLSLFVACQSSDNGDGQEGGRATHTGTGDEVTYDIAKVGTLYGDIFFWMYDETPLHKAMFTKLAQESYYNQFAFNRVIQDFVIQGGCPDEREFFENSPYLIEPEFVKGLTHTYGAVGMGRDDNPGKLSNGCQFYIVNTETGLSRLDMNYTVFGTVIHGLDVLEAIEHVETDSADEPVKPIDLTVTIERRTEEELLHEFGWTLPS